MCTSKASKLSTSGETEVAGGKEIDAHVAHKLPRSPHVTAACSVSICTLVPVKQGKKILFFSKLPCSPHVTAACSVSIRTLVPVKQGKKMYYLTLSLFLSLSLILCIFFQSWKKRDDDWQGLLIKWPLPIIVSKHFTYFCTSKASNFVPVKQVIWVPAALANHRL